MMPLWVKLFMLNKEKVMAIGKVNVSINPETMGLLKAERVRLTQDLGFVPSYSQVIQYLVKPSTNRPSVEMLAKDLMKGE
jgi:hypothetical protein